MKKLNCSIFSLLILLMIIMLSNLVNAAGFVQVGDNYKYEYNGSFASNVIVVDDMDYYYIDKDGFMAKNTWIVFDDKTTYYAGYNGKLYKNGVYSIADKSYFFNYEGKRQTGWIEDMYYANEDGSLVSGFQQLEIPIEWYTEERKERNAWFYFNTTNYKKVYSDTDTYVAKIIGSSKYCFDENGIMRTGWRMVKETDPVMKGYMYFVPEENENFKYGEAITNSWYSLSPPDEVLSNSEVKYFYFTSTGFLKCADAGSYIKYSINQKTYLFNEYGYACYGIKKVGNEYYYFGNSTKDCSMKTGKFTLNDGNGNVNDYYFLDSGIGFTGVHNNKLYYKGVLQKADSHSKYVAYRIDNSARLVNSAGAIMKNKNKLKDGDGNRWTTNSGGVVVDNDEGEILDPEPPSVTEE